MLVQRSSASGRYQRRLCLGSSHTSAPTGRDLLISNDQSNHESTEIYEGRDTRRQEAVRIARGANCVLPCR